MQNYKACLAKPFLNTSMTLLKLIPNSCNIERKKSAALFPCGSNPCPCHFLTGKSHVTRPRCFYIHGYLYLSVKIKLLMIIVI